MILQLAPLDSSENLLARVATALTSHPRNRVVRAAKHLRHLRYRQVLPEYDFHLWSGPFFIVVCGGLQRRVDVLGGPSLLVPLLPLGMRFSVGGVDFLVLRTNDDHAGLASGNQV